MIKNGHRLWHGLGIVDEGGAFGESERGAPRPARWMRLI